MAVRSGLGFRVTGLHGHADLFDEAPSRVVACIVPEDFDAIRVRAAAAGVPVETLGRAGGDRLVVEGLIDVSLGEATARWKGTLPAAMVAPSEH
jgi:phosphoribosylformylglycinamidine synthase